MCVWALPKQPVHSSHCILKGVHVPKQGAAANERMYCTDVKLLGSGLPQGPQEGTCRRSLPKAPAEGPLPWKVPSNCPLCLCWLESCSVAISCLGVLFYPSDVASSIKTCVPTSLSSKPFPHLSPNQNLRGGSSRETELTHLCRLLPPDSPGWCPLSTCCLSLSSPFPCHVLTHMTSLLRHQT